MDDLIFLSQIDKTLCLSWSSRIAPCEVECPIGLEIEAFVAATRKGDFVGGLEIIRRKTPFAGVLGRVCTHPCESVCRRAAVDDAVSIKGIKRFLADYERNQVGKTAKTAVFGSKGRVAIVGSGPAGLACAYDLAREGFAVTVYEGEDQAGGWMRYGIPRYRLPAEVLDYEIDYVKEKGVDIKLNTKVGRDIQLEVLNKEHDALFLACGFWESRKIDIKGSGLAGVFWGTEFLKLANLPEKPTLHGTVAVIGGGNVAVDAAMTSLRLGAREVKVFCLESEAEMPAFRRELELAVDEGVQIGCSWGPQIIAGRDGRVSGIEFVKCTSVFDSEGCFKPVFRSSETLSVTTDFVILAIGQTTDVSFIKSGSILLKGDLIVIDPKTLETSSPGIFAGGDVIYRPGSVVQALASGQKAAISIARYLGNRDLREGRMETKPVPPDLPLAKVPAVPRVRMPVVEAAYRSSSFAEIEIGFDGRMVKEEADRCLRCYTCHHCTDVWSCSAFLFKNNGAKESPVIDATLCEGCGVCASNCPYNSVILGSPTADCRSEFN